MSRPRSYLSFSQLTTFEMSEEKYVEMYIYGEKKRISRNIKLGSDLAHGLENGEASGDPVLDLVMAKLPKFEVMDQPVIAPKDKGETVQYSRGKGLAEAYVPIIKNNGDDIPILALPDTAKRDLTAFKEYKSSTRKWTQRMVDESGQITFYATAIWLATGKIPDDIELVCAQTAYNDDGSLYATGDIFRIRTHRKMPEIIKMITRMRKAWAGIKTLSEKELL